MYNEVLNAPLLALLKWSLGCDSFTEVPGVSFPSYVNFGADCDISYCESQTASLTKVLSE